jgi:NAD(P)-dependent dehydrogenase (short-subunit alcohol dehydrogenase family)
VSQPDQITALFQQVDQVFGRLDILVNNVGIIVRERPENLSLESWERVLRVNLTGAFLCAQEAGRRMIARGTEPPGTEPPGTEPPGTEPSGTEPSGTEPPGTGGSIINISSISGWSALGRGNLAYSVSKSAINQLTRELAVEWAKHKIRVNALMPAQVRTAYLQRMFADPNFDGQGLLQRLLTGIPLNRLGEVEDLVGPAVFLASDASAFITGALLPVDGGNLALNAGGSKDW